MKRLRSSLSLILVFMALAAIAVRAEKSYAGEKPVRQTEIIVPYTEYQWWLVRWTNNYPECTLITDHEGLPNGDDIFMQCGKFLYDEWFATGSCPEAETEEAAECKGLYMHQVNAQPMQKTVLVDLPLPEAWINLEGCTPLPPDYHCETLPNLLITSQEPLPNETVIQVQGTYNGIPFLCDGATCSVPLRPTLLDGALVEFWVDSSFGDASEHFSALVRVVDSGISQDAGGSGWYVNVLSDRYQGEQGGSCEQSWGAFPPIEGLPAWLTTPESPERLASEEPYQYLAGRLIAAGQVDASDCPAGGLESNGYANTCGIEKALPSVQSWQNQFDQQIFTVAQETGIPAQLMKNVIAQESQFWPGVYRQAEEYGFGQLTDLGADTVLLWNDTFFYQFCPLVLSEASCAVGYAQLSQEDQATLRGALAIKVNADCPTCPEGIDLSHANFTIHYLAQTLKANCAQAGQIVSNARGKNPGVASSYEDLWRFTLVNYHAGPGCLAGAINSIPLANTLDWSSVAASLNTKCPGASDYVELISR